MTARPGLLAFGEAAATGVHGANRFASNSLLEGLVFGMAAANRLEREWPRLSADLALEPALTLTAVGSPLTLDEIAALRARLQRAMSRHLGVVRDAAGLARARKEIESIATDLRSGSARATEANDEDATRFLGATQSCRRRTVGHRCGRPPRGESRGALPRRFSGDQLRSGWPALAQSSRWIVSLRLSRRGVHEQGTLSRLA